MKKKTNKCIVTSEKKFLSQDIIEFFEDKKNISWGIKDITEFVDVLSNKIENAHYIEFKNLDTALFSMAMAKGKGERQLKEAKRKWLMALETVKKITRKLK